MVLSGYKNLCVVIMQWNNYDTKLQNMIEAGIRKGIYPPAFDNCLSYMQKFQDFLHWSSNGKYDRFEDMRPVSNQPGKIYAITKTHKFDSLENIIQNHKFHPMLFQMGLILIMLQRYYQNTWDYYVKMNAKSTTHRLLLYRLKRNPH